MISSAIIPSPGQMVVRYIVIQYIIIYHNILFLQARWSSTEQRRAYRWCCHFYQWGRGGKFEDLHLKRQNKMKYSQTVTWQNGGTRARWDWSSKSWCQPFLCYHYTILTSFNITNTTITTTITTISTIITSSPSSPLWSGWPGQRRLGEGCPMSLWGRTTSNGEKRLSLFFSFSFFEILQTVRGQNPSGLFF